jgi:hypothetical protein
MNFNSIKSSLLKKTPSTTSESDSSKVKRPSLFSLGKSKESEKSIDVATESIPSQESELDADEVKIKKQNSFTKLIRAVTFSNVSKKLSNSSSDDLIPAASSSEELALRNEEDSAPLGMQHTILLCSHDICIMYRTSRRPSGFCK